MIYWFDGSGDGRGIEITAYLRLLLWLCIAFGYTSKTRYVTFRGVQSRITHTQHLSLNQKPPTKIRVLSITL